MQEWMSSPLFGVLLSILAFEAGLYLNRKSGLSVLNPLFVGIVFIIVFLFKFNITLDVYNKGGSLISFFLGPATVILAVPLYRQVHLLKKDFVPIMIGITVGCVTAITSIYYCSRLLGLSNTLIASLVPKSVTTPIGVEVSKQIGGLPSLTVAAIIISGIVGAVMGPSVCRFFGIKDKIAVGICIGTSSHAVGTTKAVELGETEGAMSALAIGVAGLVTVFLAPALMKIL